MQSTKSKIITPLPLFDTMEHIGNVFNLSNQPAHFVETDYTCAIKFLQSYNGSQGTFNAYRREVERLLHWSWLIAAKAITELKREHIEAYVHFCQSPPEQWIGLTKTARFIAEQGERVPNSAWRPFVATVSKLQHRQGIKPDRKNYQLSQNALKEIFAILSSFFNFLVQEEVMPTNPVAHIRQKSKFLRKQQGKPKIRRLSELQWDYVILTAETMAVENPEQHERTLFIMTALYSMYLRISELAASERWTPQMCDFHRDHDGLWWFTTVGKGNKERQIAVSHKMMDALKRYRRSLNLTALPTTADLSPLLLKTRGKGPLSDTRHIRRIVQACFDLAVASLEKDGFAEDAENLLTATVHWLRHTGISDDVKHRPREHVRDDAGHSSSAITDKYIDVEFRERHASAINKPVKLEDD